MRDKVKTGTNILRYNTQYGGIIPKVLKYIYYQDIQRIVFYVSGVWWQRDGSTAEETLSETSSLGSLSTCREVRKLKWRD